MIVVELKRGLSFLGAHVLATHAFAPRFPRVLCPSTLRPDPYSNLHERFPENPFDLIQDQLGCSQIIYFSSVLCHALQLWRCLTL